MDSWKELHRLLLLFHRHKWHLGQWWLGKSMSLLSRAAFRWCFLLFRVWWKAGSPWSRALALSNSIPLAGHPSWCSDPSGGNSDPGERQRMRNGMLWGTNPIYMWKERGPLASCLRICPLWALSTPFGIGALVFLPLSIFKPILCILYL